MIKMEELNIQTIAKYIIKNHPDCCFSCNYDYDYIKKADNEFLLNECKNFFFYEILNTCGCGRPDDTASVIKDILNIINDYYNETQNYNREEINIAHDKKIKRLNSLCGVEIKDNTNYNGLIQFVLYMLDHAGFLEHGSSIGGAWLTDLGRMFLYFLNSVELDVD